MLTVRKFWLLVVTCVFFFHFPAAILAGTNVSTDIETDTVWTIADSPFVISDNIVVLEGTTLTIEPGAEVDFGYQKALTINGTLIARGTSDAKIRFTANRSWAHWGYILFSTTSIDAVFDTNGNYAAGSILEHCIIENAGSADLKDNAALILNSAAPYVHACTIRNNISRGLLVYNDAAPRIVGNTIQDNTAEAEGAGIFIKSREMVAVTHNVVRRNTVTADRSYGGGIYAIGKSRTERTAIIENNWIEENKSTYGGGGIYAQYARIRYNYIYNNQGGRYGGGGINANYTDVEQNIVAGNLSLSYEGGGIKMGNGNLNSNIIADNELMFESGSTIGIKGGGARVSSADSVSANAIIGNRTRNTSESDSPEYGAGLCLYFPKTAVISNNTIVGNQVSQLDGKGGIFIDYNGSVINYNTSLTDNNIYDNDGVYLHYHAAQNSPILNAQNNHWGTIDVAQIDALIYDYRDDSALAAVDFQPVSPTFIASAPMSPPTDVIIEQGPDPHSISVSWTADPKGETPAGFIVYWDAGDGYPYQNAVDVGTATNYTITDTQGTTCRVAVTAYDENYAIANDLSETLVNDNQVLGYESWYCATQSFKSGPTIEVSAPAYDFGNVTTETTTAPVDIIISNTGNEPLDIGTLTLSGPNADRYSISADNATGQTLQPKKNATVSIAFSPDTPGLNRAELTIPSDDGDQAVLTIVLTGVGEPPIIVGTIIWATDKFGCGAPAIGSNGTIYAGSNETFPGTSNRKLYAFSPNGSVQWTYPIEGDAYNVSPAIARDGTIYMGSVFGKKFYAINPDGTTKWVYEAEAWKNNAGWTWSSPALGSDGTIYFGSREKGATRDWENGKLYAINPDNTVKWETVVGTPSTTPAIALDGTIYTGTGGGYLYAVNPDGSVKWIFEPGYKHWLESHPAIGMDGTIYLGMRDYTGYGLFAISPDGLKKWIFYTGSVIKTAPVIGADGTVYGGAGDTFYAVSPDGTLLWSYELEDGVQTGSAVIGSYGTIYFTASDKRVYALNPHGTLKWSFDVGDTVEKAPALGHDGTLFIGGAWSKILALSSASMGPADSAWPMLSHDAHHSGDFARSENYFPLIEFTSVQRSIEFDSVKLAATSLEDPDGTIISHLWDQIAGMPVTLAGATSSSATFQAPNVGVDGDEMVFRLTVADTEGLQSRETVRIQISDSLVTPAALAYDKTVTGTASTPRVVTIDNRTDQPITVSTIELTDAENFTIDFNAGPNPVGSLPTTLPTGNQATMAIQFTPLVGGLFREGLAIESNDMQSPVFEVMLTGQARLDAARENFVVALGQDKTFNGYNIDQVAGVGESDTQNALARLQLGTQQVASAQAMAGARFQVYQGEVANTYMDAMVSLTVTYRLKVDFDVLPPSEKGGGSANARIYGWICGYKKELDAISFVHDSGADERSGTVTFTQQLSQSPLWTHLHDGRTYEVMAEVHVTGDVNAGYTALSHAEVTVDNVTIDFNEDDIQPPPPPPEPTQDLPTARPGYVITEKYDKLYGPVEIAVGPDGSVYIASEGRQPSVYNDFITHIAPDGSTVRQFIADLDGASGMAVDDNGNIYVSQDTENEIHKYDADGNLLITFESHRPGLSDPNTLTLTNDGRLLAPAETVPPDGQWRIMAFDTETGARLEDFTAPFTFGFVNTVVFHENKVTIAGSRGSNSSGPILIAEEGRTPVAFAFNDVMPNVVNGLAIAEDGTIYITDNNRLMGVTPDGRFFVLAENFIHARGVAVRADACVLVSDFLNGTGGRLVEICPSTDDAETITARVIDDDNHPIPGATIENLNVPGYRTTSDAQGFFTLAGWPEASHVYRVTKNGYLPTYTFPRSSDEFAVKNDIVMISEPAAVNAYVNCNEPRDPTKGTILGIVVDRSDTELAGARVFLTPSSGRIVYLDDNGYPDFSLTRTGPSAFSSF